MFHTPPHLVFDVYDSMGNSKYFNPYKPLPNCPFLVKPGPPPEPEYCYVPECYCCETERVYQKRKMVPNYLGFVPNFQFLFGKTYGTQTTQAIHLFNNNIAKVKHTMEIKELVEDRCCGGPPCADAEIVECVPWNYNIDDYIMSDCAMGDGFIEDCMRNYQNGEKVESILKLQVPQNKPKDKPKKIKKKVNVKKPQLDKSYKNPLQFAMSNKIAVTAEKSKYSKSKSSKFKYSKSKFKSKSFESSLYKSAKRMNSLESGTCKKTPPPPPKRKPAENNNLTKSASCACSLHPCSQFLPLSYSDYPPCNCYYPCLCDPSKFCPSYTSSCECDPTKGFPCYSPSDHPYDCSTYYPSDHPSKCSPACRCDCWGITCSPVSTGLQGSAGGLIPGKIFVMECC